MNLGLLSKLLGLVAVLIGAMMIFSLPWAFWEGDWSVGQERRGFVGLAGAVVVCLAVGGIFRHWGRNSKGQLFRKEAMAVVGLSWILATVLGALPYTLSRTQMRRGVPMSFVDAMFESQSGFSTTGATVISDLEE